ncbi:MAG: lipid-A-disaccharide synthase-related protein [Cyanobium sp.]
MPSDQPPSLLVLSNGHGEDGIALRLIEALQQRRPGLDVAVLPLVGTGEAYATAERSGLLRRVGPRRPLPSGGFSNQSLGGLLQDLAAGLPLLSWQQARLVRAWGRRGLPMLAVGDLLPLLLAWAGGGPYGFIGTPKSDYTWASPPPPGWGRSPLADAYHRCKGSEWDPWEWALMRGRRCRLVAVRDRLTARGLRRRGVAAEAPGNPMMDGLACPPLPEALQGRRRLILLAGSRLPEALTNLRRLLQALASSSSVPRDGGAGEPGPAGLTLLLATGSRPSPAELAGPLQEAGFQPMSDQQAELRRAAAGGAPPAALWRRGPTELWVGPGRFSPWAGWAELGLATAGTATEQLVGLGIAALSLPGRGPQFQAGFARRQSRLLGGAVLPCGSPEALREALETLWQDADTRQRRGRIGRQRMGGAGGSARLAALIDQRLLARGAGAPPPF